MSRGVSVIIFIKSFNENQLFSAFFLTSTIAYGNCFTFNSRLYNNESFEVFQTSIAGPNFGKNRNQIQNIIRFFLGLSMIIDLNQAAYMRNGLTKGAGARVSLHHTDYV